MKRYLLLILTVILITIIPCGLIFASDITNADYYGVITATNDDIEATGVSTNISNLNTGEMISQSWLNSSANNCAIQYSGSDIPFMPGYVDNPWAMYISTINDYAQLSYTLYTGDVTGGDIAYFPGEDGAAVTDNANIEIGDNFTIFMNGVFVDTGNADYIALKSKALSLYIAATGNIRATIRTAARGNVSPTSNNDPSSDWTNEANAYDDNTTSYSGTGVKSGAWTGYLELYVAEMWVDNIRIWTYQDSDHTSSDIDYYDGSWHDLYQGNMTHDDWSTLSLPATTQITGLRFRQYVENAAGGLLLEANFHEATYISYLNGTITKGNHDLELLADTANFTLKSDGSTLASVALNGASVPDNANDWQFGSNTTLYMHDFAIAVNGANISSWDWQYDSIFHDQSGGGNHATPTFRTNSSDADITASLASFQPISEPEAPAFVVGEGPDWFSENITISGNFSTSNVSLQYPGRDLIESLSNATSTPAQFPTTMITGFIILACSITACAFLRQYGSASLFLKIAVLFVGFGMATGLQIYDWWMIIFLGIFAIAVMYMSKESRT